MTDRGQSRRAIQGSPRLEHASARELRASLQVERTDPWARGHFPCLPIYPGMLLVSTFEALARRAWGGEEPETLRARFFAPVLPPAELELRLRRQRDEEEGYEVEGTAWERGSGTRVCRVRFRFPVPVCHRGRGDARHPPVSDDGGRDGC